MNKADIANQVDVAIQANIAEVHVDFLLWEELQSSDQFVRRFVTHCVGEDDFVSLSGPIERSVSNQRGESDLLLVYVNRDARRVALMIEDKIGAALQPRQAERYRERGQDGIPRSWDYFITCIVAPERYLDGVDGFDVALSLQEISGWIDCGGDERRTAFKRFVLDAAINKEQTIGAKVVDEAVTVFRQGYFALLRSEFPELQMASPKPSYAGETWFRIKHASLPMGAWVHHKSDRGYVDLCFPNLNVKALSALRDLLEPGQTVVQTGKSASVRVAVPTIGSFADFATEAGNVRKGMEAAERLLRLYSREQRSFDQILEAR